MPHPKHLLPLCAAVLLALACLLPLSGTALAQDPTKVVYAFDREFPPFSFEQNGEAAGFDVDLLRAALRGRNVELTFRPMSWDKVQMELSAGTVHITSGMAKTRKRELLYNFSDRPILPLKVRLFTRSHNRVGNVEQLRGKSVAVQKGSLYQRILEDFGGLNIKLYPSELDALRALSKDETDAFCGADKTAYYYIDKLDITGISGVGTPLRVTWVYYAVNKDRRELLDMVNQGMRRVHENGEYDRLFRKWFVPELTQGERQRMLQAARDAAINAYAPYSGTVEGAAVLTRSGTVVTGCPVENGVAGLGATALQVALQAAVASGEYEFKAVVKVDAQGRALMPTATERRLLREFGREGLVVTEPEPGEYVVRMIPELLPWATGLRIQEDLE